MEYFETKSVINKDTSYQELKRHLRKPNDRRFLILYPIPCLAFLILGIFIQSIFASFVGIFGIIIVLLIIIRSKLNQNRAWEQVKENSDIAEIVQVVSFTEDSIKMHDPITNGTVYTKYDHIDRFAETKNMYALFTKANQVFIVNKVILAQEQKTEEFLRFIQDKCKNVRWKK